MIEEKKYILKRNTKEGQKNNTYWGEIQGKDRGNI